MDPRKVLASKGFLAIVVTATLLAASAARAEETGRSFEIYGFAQADYIQDISGRLDPDWDDAFRPSKICFDGACGEDGQASLSVKQSRFGVKGTMPTGSSTAPLRYAVSGLQSLQGALLAVEDLNREGGIHGRPLRLAKYRTGSYFVDARAAAAMAVRDGALAIVGANSSELSRAVAEVAEPAGILQITNVSTAADLTRDLPSGPGRRFVFRMCASDDVMGAHLAAFASQRLGARTAAVLYEVGRTYSQRLARSFVSRFHDTETGRVAAELTYLALETDFQ